ncbi:MAG: hypothetical protein ACOC3T_04960 [Bacteroidota bacterium]
MKRIVLFSIALFLFFLSCDRVKSGQATNTTQSDNTQEFIKKTKEFFHWYKQNYETLGNIQLIDLVKVDSTYIYKVNTDSTKRYLNILESSGFFSDSFIKEKQDYFIEAGRKLLEVKQSDGPPVGFEFDLLLLTQEASLYLDNIKDINYSVKDTSETTTKISVNNDLIFEYQNNNSLIKSIRKDIK